MREEGLGKLSTNRANLTAIFGNLFDLTTSKLLQKENPETIEPDAQFKKRKFFFEFSHSMNFVILFNHFICLVVFVFFSGGDYFF